MINRQLLPHIILLIAVSDGSLQWEEGIAVALNCRDIREFQILNVEVEIREGKYEHYAASEKLEAQIDTEAWGLHSTTNELVLPLLSYVGYPVGYFEDRKGKGTLGLHLRLEGYESTVYGLTCRHVVHNDRLPHEIYELSTEDKRQYHKGLDEPIAELQTKQTRWDQWYSMVEGRESRCPEEQDISNLRDLKAQAVHNKTIIGRMNKINEKEARKIGHLAFHPDFRVSSRTPGYLKDWALIELDNERFLSALDNKVFIGGDSESCIFDFDGQIVGLLTGGATYVKPYDWRGIPTIKGDPSGSRELKRHPGNNISPEAPTDTAKGDLDTWAKGTDVTFAALIEWVLDNIQDFTGLKPQRA
ncbi:hypothetical protein DL765_000661 [Monosporascus sp. GIB2]|nr:hypothetical protein DL765_000661 [Monosporascus sp. GIB2]